MSTKPGRHSFRGVPIIILNPSTQMPAQAPTMATPTGKPTLPICGRSERTNRKETREDLSPVGRPWPKTLTGHAHLYLDQVAWHLGPSSHAPKYYFSLCSPARCTLQYFLPSPLSATTQLHTASSSSSSSTYTSRTTYVSFEPSPL